MICKLIVKLTLELTLTKESHSFSQIAKTVEKEYKPVSNKNNKFFWLHFANKLVIKVLSPVPLPWMKPYAKSRIRRVDADSKVTILSMEKALSPRPYLDLPNLSRLL